MQIKINKTYIASDKALLLLLVALPSSFIWSFKLPTILLILLIIKFIIDLIYGKIKINWDKTILIFSIPFILSLIGILNTENIDNGIRYITRNVSMFIFPIILFNYSPLKKTTLSIIFNVFLFNVIIFFLIKFILFHIDGVEINNFNRTFLSEGLHPTYFGLYLTFAISYCLYQLENSFRKKNYIYLVLLLVLIVEQFMLSSKINWIITIMLALFFILNQIKSNQLRFVFICLIIFLILFSYTKNYRINQSVNNLISYINKSYPDNDDMYIYRSDIVRFRIWKYGIELFKENPFFGCGTGDVGDKLIYKYKESNEIERFLKFNLHNQYLDYIVRYGIIGLIFFLPLFYSINRSYKKNYNLLFYFIIIMTICCITESMLQRQRGIMFYAFFNALLFYNGNFLNNKDDI